MLWLFIAAIAIFVSSLVSRQKKKIPEIDSITPPVAVPGEVLSIEGRNFGNNRDSSYVEIAGSRITSSAYRAWNDTHIELTLPSNVQDGLVYIVTTQGKSEASFFANSSHIPVPVKSDPTTTLPVISSISPENAKTGQTIVITGSNFGIARDSSQIFFTTARETNNTIGSQNRITDDSDNYIAASSNDYDYEYWSDTEIRVRVPDGASTGNIFVSTSKGNSGTQSLTVSHPAGNKNFGSKHTYIIQLSADIATSVPDQDSTITLYIPRPPVTSSQPQAELNECYPEPLIKDDPRDIIYQRTLNNIINNKQRFSQNFVITVYPITSNIKKDNIKPYSDTKRLLYTAYTTSDNLIKSNEPIIIELKDKIIGKETNPYQQARLIYNYMIENYDLTTNNKTVTANPLDLAFKKKGDAYDFAILYTSLCRAAGIPSIPLSGILVDNNVTNKNHWWTELYFENYGWFPVDIALGARMEYNSFATVENPKEFYFGNLDSQHITISRGWNQIRSSLSDSKIVYRPKTYAMQSTWEEAGSQTSSYSSLWNNPVIMGIY